MRDGGAMNSGIGVGAGQNRAGFPALSTSAIVRHWPLVVVFLSFAVVGSLRSPIPGVNEPHYLCKALHTFQPEWCARDPFISSIDAHAVFLTAFGPVTAWLGFTGAAWLGRILVWLGLAWGWTRLVGLVSKHPADAVRAAWLYLGIAACGSYSGEWLIGGVESKGFAYVALFAAWRWAGDGAFLRAAVAGGIATSLHPVVGVWGLLCAVTGCLVAHDWKLSPVNGGFAGSSVILGQVLRRGPLVAAGWLLAALPGLLPVLAMLAAPAEVGVKQAADQIQVFVRLGHHLNPFQFPWRADANAAVLIVIWLLFRRNWPADRAARFLWGTISAAACLATLGFLIATAGSATLMKFYPFRLFDACLPIGVACGGILLLRTYLAGRQWLASAVTFAAFGLAVALPAVDRNPSRLDPQRLAAWKEMCRWVDQKLPPEALLVTPSYSYAFKWYARRAEYFNYKDCPQDAAGIVAWQKRRQWISAWRDRHYPRAYAAPALQQLRHHTHAEYLVASTGVQLAETPLYANQYFAVYRLPETNESGNAPF